MNHPTAEQALQTIINGRHPWKEFVPNELDLNLIREYLRRQALWTFALNNKSIYPIGDLAGALAPDSDWTREEYFRKELVQLTQSTIVLPPCMWCLKFYELLETRDVLTEFNLPNPYEPLLLMFANGRWIWGETGGLQYGLAYIPTHYRLEQYAQREPIELNEVYDIYR